MGPARAWAEDKDMDDELGGEVRSEGLLGEQPPDSDLCPGLAAWCHLTIQDPGREPKERVWGLHRLS